MRPVADDTEGREKGPQRCPSCPASRPFWGTRGQRTNTRCEGADGRLNAAQTVKLLRRRLPARLKTAAGYVLLFVVPAA
jgi:hypothetical protein